MFHKLLHRGLPGCFAFNSVYAMQPMYTSKDNEKILTRLKTLDQFSLEKPALPQQNYLADSYTKVKQVLQNEGSLKSPWMTLEGTYVSEKAIDAYASFQKEEKSSQLYGSPKAAKIYLDYLTGKAKSLVEGAAYCLRGQSSKAKYNQIDFVRE